MWFWTSPQIKLQEKCFERKEICIYPAQLNANLWKHLMMVQCLLFWASRYVSAGQAHLFEGALHSTPWSHWAGQGGPSDENCLFCTKQCNKGQRSQVGFQKWEMRPCYKDWHGRGTNQLLDSRSWIPRGSCCRKKTGTFSFPRVKGFLILKVFCF